MKPILSIFFLVLTLTSNAEAFCKRLKKFEAPSLPPPLTYAEACDSSLFPLSKGIERATQNMIHKIENNVGELLISEKFLLTRGYGYLIGSLALKNADEKSQFFSILKACELSSAAEAIEKGFDNQTHSKFALDRHQIQIGRKSGSNFIRFGLLVHSHLPKTSIRSKLKLTQILVRTRSVFDDVKLSEQAPDVEKYVNNLHSQGQFALAILGAARTIKDTRQLKEAATNIINAIIQERGTNFAVITGGYKGARDNVYGVTRAGFEAARERCLGSIVIMPQAGKDDAHVNDVHARNYVGEMWGDDSAALVKAADAAIVFGPSYGLWTEIEIANLEAQGKPYIIIDPSKRFEEINFSIRNLLNHPKLQEYALRNLFNEAIDPFAILPLTRGITHKYDHHHKTWKISYAYLDDQDDEITSN